MLSNYLDGVSFLANSIMKWHSGSMEEANLSIHSSINAFDTFNKEFYGFINSWPGIDSGDSTINSQFSETDTSSRGIDIFERIERNAPSTLNDALNLLNELSEEANNLLQEINFEDSRDGLNGAGSINDILVVNLLALQGMEFLAAPE